MSFLTPKKFIGFSLLFVALTFLGYSFVNASAWLKSAFPLDRFDKALRQHSSESWKAQLQYSAVRYEPGWMGQVVLKDVIVRDAQTQELLLKASQARLPVEFPDWRSQAISFGTIQLKDAVFYVRRNFQGRWNWEMTKRGEPSQDVLHWLGRNWTIRFKGVEADKSAQIRYADWTLQPTFFYTVLQTSLSVIPDAAGRALQIDAVSPAIHFSGLYEWRQDRGQFELSDSLRTAMLEVHFEDFSDHPDFKYNLDLRGVRYPIVEKVLETAGLRGDVTLKVEGSGVGASPPEWLNSLYMRGAMDVRRGTYGDENIGHVVMVKMGVKSPEVQGRDKGMPFQIFQAGIEMSQGVLRLSQVRMQNAGYILEADGMINLRQQDADIVAKIVWSSEQSHRWTQIAPKLASLVNDRGRIALPFTLRGMLPQPSVFLDRAMMGPAAKEVLESSPATG